MLQCLLRHIYMCLRKDRQLYVLMFTFYMAFLGLASLALIFGTRNLSPGFNINNNYKVNHLNFNLRINPKAYEEQPLVKYINAALGEYMYNPVEVVSYINDSWRMSDICRPITAEFLRENINFYPALFNSQAGSSRLYVHDPLKDSISRTIQTRRSFEPENIDTVMTILRQNPEVSLIDIGTNVGQHAIAAALLGRHVIAIDAAKENIQHVCASVEYENMTDRVTLIWNALSDKHEKARFRHGGNGDFGLSHVDEDKIYAQMNKRFKKYFKKGRYRHIYSVKLDDFLALPRFKLMRRVFIKLDVEGHEHRVLLGGKRFMNDFRDRIFGILMEWQWFKGRDAEDIILNLMDLWNFKPYQFVGKMKQLSQNSTDDWPNDVLWLQK